MTTEVHHVARTFADHLPVLAVLVPFLAAPLTVLIGHRRLAWPIAFAACVASFLISVTLLLKVYQGGVISYHIGGWAPPLGIEYRIDAANAIVLLLISAVATIVLPFTAPSIKAEVDERHHTLFYTAYMLCFTGLMGMVATGDAFNVFVFLEISSLSTYVLVAMGANTDKRALTAAYDYLIMGTIGATFFVIGIGFLYAATGTLNMADLAAHIRAQGMDRTLQTAFAFILVGMGLKVAVYPMHLWLPNAYTYAPSAVSTFLAATATKAAIYVLLRFMFSVFEPEFLHQMNAIQAIMLPLALIAMFAASLIAAFQSDLKRMLAYSSIAQIGYILVGIAFLSTTGLTGAVVHLFNHGITKAALFMGVGALVLRSGSSFYLKLEGLGKIMPWTSAAIVIAGLSLIGVPGTAGFISKWVLVQAALEQGWWPIAMAIVLSSLLAVIYVWRVIETLYMKQPASGLTHQEAPLSMLVPMWIMALATIWFGFDTDLVLTAARSAADGFLHGFHMTGTH
ncbi:MAG: cation:proton antiporter [Rhodobacterales bacterium]|nr:MAG: cation:proton antiporter [Rhodobacterales bacterium]